MKLTTSRHFHASGQYRQADVCEKSGLVTTGLSYPAGAGFEGARFTIDLGAIHPSDAVKQYYYLSLSANEARQLIESLHADLHRVAFYMGKEKRSNSLGLLAGSPQPEKLTDLLNRAAAELNSYAADRPNDDESLPAALSLVDSLRNVAALLKF